MAKRTDRRKFDRAAYEFKVKANLGKKLHVRTKIVTPYERDVIVSELKRRGLSVDVISDETIIRSKLRNSAIRRGETFQQECLIRNRTYKSIKDYINKQKSTGKRHGILAVRRSRYGTFKRLASSDSNIEPTRPITDPPPRPPKPKLGKP